MKTGNLGLALIKKAEGFVAKIYDDQGHPAIGYGQRLTPSEVEKYKNGISEEDASLLLVDYLHTIENTVSNVIKTKLNQNQFDAVMSFTYNVGIGAFISSTLLKVINANQLDKAPDEFAKWTKSGGKELPGLVARRKAEVALWNGTLKL